MWISLFNEEVLLCEVLFHAEEYLKQLPCGEMYEKSYMHKDTVTHLAVDLQITVD